MNEIQNTDTLTAEILILKQQTAHNIMEIGKRLIFVKESLPHGEWGKYLKEKVDFSQVTANKFMKISEEYSNLKAPLDLGSEKLWLLLEVPPEERGEFVQVNDVEAMSTRDLHKAIKERDEARKHSDEKALEAKNNLDEKFKVEDQLRITDEVLRAAQKTNKGLEDRLGREEKKSEEKICNLQKSIAEAKEELTKAQASGSHDEEEKLLDLIGEKADEVVRLQTSLQESQNDLDSSAKKIDELEAQLESKHIDVITAEPVIIEKIPEAIEKELEELRSRSLQGANTSVTEFKVYFKYLSETFDKELKLMAQLKESNPAIYEKCKSNILRLINIMSERL